MPDLALALLAFAPPADSGVWLDAPPEPGTVLTAPFDVTGETQALEGVLAVELHVVRGRAVRLVETYEPTLPLGTIPFELTLDPATMAPGRVTLRVVATTALRGFSAEIPGLVVPHPAALPRLVHVAPPPRVTRAAPVAPAPVRRLPETAPRLDDSGRAFGRSAPVLPYAPPAGPAPAAPVTRAAAPAELPPERSGWLSVAAGLLLLVTCSHLHRALRPQPDPREPR